MIQATSTIYLALLGITVTVARENLNCEDVTRLYEADLYNLDSWSIESMGFSIKEDIPLKKPITSSAESPCNAYGRLKITFPETNGGEQMYRLKIRLNLDHPNSLSGPTFNIGDAADNAGVWEAPTTDYSAEVFSNYDRLTVYGRLQQPLNKQAPTYISDSPESVVVIGDEYVQLKDGITPQNTFTGDHLFALRGQTDYDVYVGMNQIIATNVAVETGAGLCNIEILAQKCRKQEGSDSDIEKKPLTK